MRLGVIDVTFHGYAPVGAGIELVAETGGVVVANVELRNRPRTVRGRTRLTRAEVEALVANLREVAAEPRDPEADSGVRGGEGSTDVHIALDAIDPPLEYIDQGARAGRTQRLAGIVDRFTDSLVRSREWQELSSPSTRRWRSPSRIGRLLGTIAFYVGWIAVAALVGWAWHCARR